MIWTRNDLETTVFMGSSGSKWHEIPPKQVCFEKHYFYHLTLFGFGDKQMCVLKQQASIILCPPFENPGSTTDSCGLPFPFRVLSSAFLPLFFSL